MKTKKTKLSAYPNREEMNRAMRAGVSVKEIAAAINRNNELKTLETVRDGE